jgi:ribose 5-phosphate isomerase B
MPIFIAADHRGFELKNKLIDWLKSERYQVIDCGNTIYDQEDDYPDFAFRAAKSFLKVANKKSSSLGILICGSGIGVSIAANRLKGIRCGLCFDVEQTIHAKENDHINFLALAADYLDWEKTKKIVKAFLETKEKKKGKYLRRIKKLELE